MRTAALCFTIVGLLLLLPTLCTLHYVVFEEVGQVVTCLLPSCHLTTQPYLIIPPNQRPPSGYHPN